ncbi:unnamed protein product [Rotaria sp. Silwood2]|nr:unnamed protein product [Rotaria sp. Silwood2]CAF3266948.1 unnamed protein product [Rotaria sp. Silwood2]CAF4280170.1 unnamed protein product [Rotaria sp. Silwood2]CAF4336700.1 unnamed protein product [Rotaria sp. Silwood2]
MSIFKQTESSQCPSSNKKPIDIVTIFENLSNELFLNIFEYFDAYQLHLTFGQLNSRFNSLLDNARLHFDLDSIPLHEFSSFSLSLNFNNILSFTSRNLDKTRSWLFDNNEVLQQFSLIRALTLVNVTYGIINRLHERLPNLKNTLIYVSISEATKTAKNANKDEYIYFKHWCPTHEFCSNKYRFLRYLIMDTEYNHESFGCLSPTISTIRYFKLGHIYSIIWLIHLFRYSPQLKVLYVDEIYTVLDDGDFFNRYPTKKPIIFPCAINMHIFVVKNCYCEPISIEYILRACPYLKQLYLNSTVDYINHHQTIRTQIYNPIVWQSMIDQWGQHLINLNITIKGDETFLDQDLTTEFWRLKSWQVKTLRSPPCFIIQNDHKIFDYFSLSRT